MSICLQDNTITKGASKTFVFSLTDADGNVITNLNTATDIQFYLKDNKDTEDVNASISLTLLLNPSQVDIDTPDTGDLQIALTSSDTDIDEGDYVLVINIIYSATQTEKPFFFNASGDPIDSFKVINRA